MKSNKYIVHRRVLSNFKNAGFTLMELMAVVVIVGILSAVAIPSFRRFIVQSRESEAPSSLSAIARAAHEYYNTEHLDRTTGVINPPRFPDVTNSDNKVDGYATMPVVLPCKEIVGSPSYRTNSARWYANPDKEPWYDLKFAIASSHYFQYGFNSTGSGKTATYSVRARADMDCDGTMSTFFFRANVDATTGAIVRGSIIVTNQGE
jgi:prepilin-type N-terminal cleavage/methylation domain-containing protein